MTQAATALKPATVVPEARRMAFLPALFSPALMLIGERAVYQFMSWLAPDDYTGGLWHFHERGGQPLFMSPDANKRFRIFCETNGYMGEASAMRRTSWRRPICGFTSSQATIPKPERFSRRSTDAGTPQAD